MATPPNAPAVNKVLWVPYSTTDRDVEAGAFSASSEQENYGANNLAHPHIRRVFRSAEDEDSFTISFRNSGGAGVFGGSSVNALYLLNHNLIASDTLSLLHYSLEVPFPDFWPVPTDDDGNVWPVVPYYFATPVTHAYWTVTVTSETARSIQIGRIMLGCYVQPAINIRDGFSVEYVDPSVGSAENGRQGYWSKQTGYRRITIDFGQIPEAVTNQLLDLYRRVGTHTPFVICLDPVDNPSETTMYVQFTKEMSRSRVINRDHRLGALILEEKV